MAGRTEGGAWKQPQQGKPVVPHAIVPQKRRANAKAMRKELTDAELKLWNAVRAHRLMGLSFRRQVPIAGYIVDFACSDKRLIVEVDGAQHADAPKSDADERRSERLQQDGWTVLRFWNDEVTRDIDGVCQHILIVAGVS